MDDHLTAHHCLLWELLNVTQSWSNATIVGDAGHRTWECATCGTIIHARAGESLLQQDSGLEF